jgi:hypothetical protein
MMAFLKHCDQRKAFNQMPNRIYLDNSKNMGTTTANDFEQLMREIDATRALEMPQAPRPAPPAPPPLKRWSDPDIYASFRGCTRPKHSFASVVNKKTRLNGGRKTP